ncbi:metallophosphatase domain-containing protein [Candidatus Uabimicrobium amorphum]|uniref:Calcineurin-like phosphoesterase domain-containing protein n=1 Tax=Uabimicrobium amorphum TaxID=2596890 RepID=A0A5S9F4Q4_UABAM|nr:metallophosphatase domain-containing protein [Candidatus Uabimicrobium amorphum]BBM86047.1 hypothetical protein UABAM_04433 [Candidatus Uabimicrobium amorphum]
MKIIAISDSHNKHNELCIPPGDVFIHAGDATNIGRIHELQSFSAFVNSLPHPHKIIIAGNHDPCYEQYNFCDFFHNAHFLVDECIVIDNIKFYGSPWTPAHWAYHCEKDSLQDKWQNIPHDVDVLITHMPPAKILDFDVNAHKHQGCKYLAKRVQQIQPKYHIFGHVHSNGTHQWNRTTFINASVCGNRYQLEYPPSVFYL